MDPRQQDKLELIEPETSHDGAQEDSAPIAPAPELAPQDRLPLLVALLFTAGERVDSSKLAQFLDISARDLSALAEEASGSLRPLGLDILPVAGGLRLVSAAQFDQPIAAFHREVRKSRLSKSSLEVLAIVAYEQPVSRAQVEDVRQVNSESTVRALLDRRLIAVAGRLDTPGRPFLYRTTDQFLEVFGLQTLADLPPRPASLNLQQPEEMDMGPFTARESDPDAREEE